MYFGVVHMKYKGIIEWWAAGTGFEELQRKAPNWLAQGSRIPSEGILLGAYKKIPVFFFPLRFMYFGLCLQNITRLFMLHISVYLYPFNSNWHFWCHCLALVVQWALGCTIWAVRKPTPFWRFLKHLSQGSTLRDMLVFTGNNIMKNNLPVN